MLKWLNHEGVPKCHRMFKTQSHLYLVYDNLSGYMLTELLQNGCPFPRGNFAFRQFWKLWEDCWMC